MKTYPTVALIILDGWGMREVTHGNAIELANTPNYDRWLAQHERSILQAAGEAVGLPADQMGNSEVGHLNLGAGRIVYQDLTRINLAIRSGSIQNNFALQDCFQRDGKVHLIGLLGDGGVHSHSDHLFALLEMAQSANKTPVVHVITDGRDTPPKSAAGFLTELEEKLAETGGLIATVSGRYHAMDRDKRWQRTERAYRAMVERQGKQASTPSEAIASSYADGVTDEFIEPTIITQQENVAIENGDSLIFFNFRADRMRQIVRAFTVLTFDGFACDYLADSRFVSMTAYADDLPTTIAFPEQEIPLPLAQVISEAGSTQFHAAETEKYAHVTYFFNGGEETPYDGEERALIQSPKVATYDLKPEMSAYELTTAVVERLEKHDDGFILVNFANPDMVGHTGVLDAAIKACEAVDTCTQKIVQAILDKGGIALVTADHGNAERMIAPETGGSHTYHTTNPVSCIFVANEYVAPRPEGILADVAPTILELLGIEQPSVMTGRSLLQHKGL